MNINKLSKVFERYKRVFEDGTISKIYGNDNYDVAIGYREFGYEEIGMSRDGIVKMKSNLEHGTPVRVGFLNGNPQLPFIMPVQAEQQLLTGGTIIRTPIFTGTWIQFESNPQRNCMVGDAFNPIVNFTSFSKALSIQQFSTNISGIAIYKGQLIVGYYTDPDLTNLTGYDIDFFSLSTNALTQRAAFDDFNHTSPVNLPSRLAINPENSHVFIAPIEERFSSENSVFSAWRDVTSGNPMQAIKGFGDSNGYYSFAGANLLVSGYNVTYTAAVANVAPGGFFGTNDDRNEPANWAAAVKLSTSSTDGALSGYNIGSDGSLNSRFSIDPGQFDNSPQDIISSNSGGDANRGFPATLDSQNWLVAYCSRQSLDVTIPSNFAICNHYGGQGLFAILSGEPISVDVGNFASSVQVRVRKITAANGTTAANVIIDSRAASDDDAFLDLGRGFWANWWQEYSDNTSGFGTNEFYSPVDIHGDPFPPDTGGNPRSVFYSETTVLSGDLLPEFAATHLLGYTGDPLNPVQPFTSGTEIAEFIGIGSTGVFPEPGLLDVTQYSAPSFTYFEGAGARLFPHITANNSMPGPARSATAYDSGSSDTTEIFFDYLASDADSNTPGLYGDSNDVVFGAYALPMRVFTIDTAERTIASVSIPSVVTFLGSNNAPATVTTSGTQYLWPSLAYVWEMFQFALDTTTMEVLWVRDASQYIYGLVNTGVGMSTTGETHPVSGTADVQAPLADNWWRQCPVGGKFPAVFVIRDLHTLGAIYQPTTILEIIDSKTANVLGLESLRVSNETITSDNNFAGSYDSGGFTVTTSTTLAYLNGDYRWQMLGSSIRVICGISSSGLPWAYVYCPQMDITTPVGQNAFHHYLYLFQMKDDGTYTKTWIDPVALNLKIPKLGEWDLTVMTAQGRIRWVESSTDTAHVFDIWELGTLDLPPN